MLDFVHVTQYSLSGFNTYENHVISRVNLNDFQRSLVMAIKFVLPRFLKL